MSELAEWWISGEHGMSSKAIALRFMLHSKGPTDHPYDPADFRRCELLMRQVPEIRTWFPAMAAASPAWARLVERWDEIVNLIATEVPGAWGPRSTNGQARRAYALIQELIAWRESEND